MQNMDWARYRAPAQQWLIWLLACLVGLWGLGMLSDFGYRWQNALLVLLIVIWGRTLAWSAAFVLAARRPLAATLPDVLLVLLRGYLRPVGWIVAGLICLSFAVVLARSEGGWQMLMAALGFLLGAGTLLVAMVRLVKLHVVAVASAVLGPRTYALRLLSGGMAAFLLLEMLSTLQWWLAAPVWALEAVGAVWLHRQAGQETASNIDKMKA